MLKLVSFLMMLLLYIPAYASTLHIDVFYSNQTDIINVKFKTNIDLMQQEQYMFLREFDANNDSEQQLFQIKQSLLRSGQLLLVNLVDKNAAQQVVDMAREKGAYVLFFDNKPRPHILSSYNKAYFVGNDAGYEGYYQGQLIMEYIKKHGSLDKNNDGVVNIAIIKGPGSDISSNVRSKSVLDYLTNVDFKYKLVDIFETDASYEAGNLSIAALVAKQKLDEVELVICTNDDLALGALNTLHIEGYNSDTSKYIPVFGIDAIAKAIAAVDYGDLSGTIDSNAKRLAHISVELLKDLQDNIQVTSIDGLKINSNKCLTVPYTTYLK